MSALPARGEIWLVDLQDGAPVPVMSPAEARTRPRTGAALVVSADGFNHGPAGSLLALPVTTAASGIPSHVPLPAGRGLGHDGFVVCEHVLSLSRSRLRRRIGRAPSSVMDAVGRYLRVLLEL